MSKIIRQLYKEASSVIEPDATDYVFELQRTFYQLIVGKCIETVLECDPTITDAVRLEVVVAIGDRFFTIDEEFTISNPVQRIAKEATEFCCQEYRNFDGSMAWVWEEAFARLIIEAALDAILGCDPSPKMIAHEPYITMEDAVWDRFYEDEDE